MGVPFQNEFMGRCDFLEPMGGCDCLEHFYG